jgi:hypothetical protein
LGTIVCSWNASDQLTDWSVSLPIAWPQSTSNQKNKTALVVDTVAAIRRKIVTLLICEHSLHFGILRSPAFQWAVAAQFFNLFGIAD